MERKKKKALNPTEGSLDKTQVGVRIELELLRKIQRKYGKGNEITPVKAILMALNECAKGVKLTADDMSEINEVRKANYEKRMAVRKAFRKHTVQGGYGNVDYSQFQ